MNTARSIPRILYDVVIIGGGPSGLTAGLYASRARLKTLLIESFSLPSQAVLTSHIENYPGFPEGISGFELIEKFKSQSKRFGLNFITGNAGGLKDCKYRKIDIWQVEVENKTYRALSVIVASGARPEKLGIRGEEKFCGRGVSYCAVCDGPFFRDKDIALVGGGDTAVEEALFLTKFARRVNLVHRKNRLRATKVLQERVFSNKKIEIIWDSVTDEILGDERVRGIRIKNLKTKKQSDVSCDGVFIFVGQVPNTDFVKGIVELDEQGYVIVDSEMKASREGIFACGDCRKTILRQVVTACGDGALAAFSAQRYVEELKGIAYK